jgi:bifunctional UDP-N-acetylglucosamine pyrophosphorylase/glucosamine-1-phosphate N-acetyltransferase
MREKVFSDIAVLVLAAGKGTRMKSDIPKVLLPLLGEALLFYPLSSVREAGLENCGVVFGHGASRVCAFLENSFPEVTAIYQEEQRGTGHAVSVAQDWWKQFRHVLVLPGDLPLLPPEALTSLCREHLSKNAACTFLTMCLEDPTGYGRVVEQNGRIRIVEDKDALPEEKAIRNVNSGIYVFDTACLERELALISPNNAQNEYYLTDVVARFGAAQLPVVMVRWPVAQDLFGVNDPVQLADAERRLRDRILGGWMRRGVRCIDPASVWIGPKVTLAEDLLIEPNVQILGESRIGAGSRIGTGSIVRDSELGERCTLVAYVVIQDSRVEGNSRIGPFAFLRDQTTIGDRALVGKFVEIKKSDIGANAKVPHLSYIGDAQVGDGTNIGAGTITCNYDGVKKNRTVIGNDCFIGSDTMLVAPVELGEGAMTGAGSVITEDVPSGALAIGRARQRNILGWRARKAKSSGHDAAEGGKS